MSEIEIIGEAQEMPVEPVPAVKPVPAPERAPEVGGREGPEPTRYGDWEKNGRCIDF